MGEPRILLYDLETAPDLGYVWQKWQTNVLDFQSNWFLLSFAWKWLGEKKTHVLGLPDFEGYEDDLENDYLLTEKLWELLDEADVTIAHNGKAFDNGKSNARFIYHGFEPPSPYKEIDTLLVARKQFTFTSSSLKDLASYLQLTEEKSDPGTFQTWLGCMAGDKKCWARMKKYNAQDVDVLEQLYLRLRPWIVGHPNLALYSDRPNACPRCSAEGTLKGRGYKYYAVTRRQQFQCSACGGYCLGRILQKLQTNYVSQ